MSRSENRKAIKSLEIQKAKIDDPMHYNDWIWVAQTADIVRKYIGENSALNSTISAYTFTTQFNEPTHTKIEFAKFWKSQEAKQFIDSCIEYIEVHGIQEKQNWFTKRTTGEILSMIAIFQALLFTIILPFTCNLGKIQGSADSKDKIYKLEFERDSFKRLVPNLSVMSDSVNNAKPSK